MQTKGKKNRSTVDNNIKVSAIAEKKRLSHENAYLFYANVENASRNYGIKIA